MHSWLPFSPWLERSICWAAYTLHSRVQTQKFVFLLTLTRWKCCSCSQVCCWASSSAHAYPCLPKHHCPNENNSWYLPLVTRRNCYWCWVAQSDFDIDKKVQGGTKRRCHPWFAAEELFCVKIWRDILRHGKFVSYHMFTWHEFNPIHCVSLCFLLCSLFAVLGTRPAENGTKQWTCLLQRWVKGLWLTFAVPKKLVEWQCKTWQIDVRFSNYLWRQRLQNSENIKMLCFHEVPWNKFFFI